MLALALACWISLGLASVGAAQDVPRLASAVTDQTGVLEADRPEIEDALQNLFERSGVQLYVLFVDTTGASSIDDYAAQVAEASNLGARDALLVVAVADRTDVITLGVGLRDVVSQVEQDRIRSDVLEAGLARGDFGGAIIATSGALGDVLNPAATLAPTQAATPGPTSSGGGPSSGGSGGVNILVLLAVIALIAGVLLITSRVLTLRRDRRAAFEEAKGQEELGRQANALLIKTDDGLRDADQELGFVEAEFGDAQVQAMHSALASAQDELKQAFVIGQKLDDSEPETAEQRRQMIEEIIARCQKAQAAIDAQRTEIERLRDLEKNAPSVLESLDAEVSRVAALLKAEPQVQARLDRYSEESIGSVGGNAEAARAKLDAARTRIAAGRKAAEESNLAAAAVAANAAQVALADAAALLGALSNLAEFARGRDTQAGWPAG